MMHPADRVNRLKGLLYHVKRVRFVLRKTMSEDSEQGKLERELFSELETAVTLLERKMLPLAKKLAKQHKKAQ